LGAAFPAGIDPVTEIIFGADSVCGVECGCDLLTSGGCSDANRLGPTVYGDLSFIGDPVDSDGDGFFDTIPFSLTGVDNGSGPDLCPVGGGQTTLAFIEVTDTLPVDDTSTITQDLSGQGVFDDNNEPLGTTEYFTAVGSTSAEVQVFIDRVPDDVPGDGTDEYLVKLETAFEVFRLTIGVKLPLGTPLGAYQFSGCPPQPVSGGAGSAVLGCTNDTLGPSVDETNSLSFGPTADLNPGTPEQDHPDVMYLTVQGELDSEDTLATNPFTLVQIPPSDESARVILGTLAIPEGDPPPVPTSEGTVLFTNLAGLGEPIMLPTGSFSIASTFLAGSGVVTSDRDGDGITDDSENCLNAFNPDQDDRGGLLQTTFDGLGDACQCGNLFKDPSKPGALFADDVVSGLKFLAGALSDPDAPEICSVSTEADGSRAGAECNIKDLVVLKRATNGAGGVQQACSRTEPSG
jgi:hypothetical protein